VAIHRLEDREAVYALIVRQAADKVLIFVKLGRGKAGADPRYS